MCIYGTLLHLAGRCFRTVQGGLTVDPFRPAELEREPRCRAAEEERETQGLPHILQIQCSCTFPTYSDQTEDL